MKQTLIGLIGTYKIYRKSVVICNFIDRVTLTNAQEWILTEAAFKRHPPMSSYIFKTRNDT